MRSKRDKTRRRGKKEPGWRGEVTGGNKRAAFPGGDAAGDRK